MWTFVCRRSNPASLTKKEAYRCAVPWEVFLTGLNVILSVRIRGNEPVGIEVLLQMNDSVQIESKQSSRDHQHKYLSTRKHSSRMRIARLQTVRASVATTTPDVTREGGPQANKFEQISSVSHQMSVAGRRGS